ncbi:hypothetical protein [Streptomyces shaanxiensis]
MCLAPGPAPSTFGLAALDALAPCRHAVRGQRLLRAAGGDPAPRGRRPPPTAGTAFADAVDLLLARSEAERRGLARARAECFGWDAAVRAFLAAHDAEAFVRRSVRGGVA